jgi:hypothetical protein
MRLFMPKASELTSSKIQNRILRAAWVTVAIAL